MVKTNTRVKKDTLRILNIMKYWVFILFLLSSCSDYKSQFICENKKCFTVIQYIPTWSKKESGIYFSYDKKKINNLKDGYVYLGYPDAPFYYRWNKDTLILRCPYWKIFEDKTANNPLVDFKNFFTDAEKEKYGYNSNVSLFYKNLLKDL